MSNKPRRLKSRSSIQRCWHYTTADRLHKIAESGRINTTSTLIERGERPAVWLSTNPEWEETVQRVVINEVGNKTPPLSRDGLLKLGIIPVRIEINCQQVRLLNWNEFKKKSRISKFCADNLEEVALEDGADPQQWRASFQPIDLKRTVCVEFWDGKAWVAAPDKYTGEQQKPAP
jgi:hypothetical protein